MQKYKFRGKEIKTGKFVYGDLVNSHSGKTLINERTTVAAKYVDPETVAQLVGYDRNGAEIYEGDLIRSHFGSSCYATFRHYAGIADGSFILDKTRI